MARQRFSDEDDDRDDDRRDRRDDRDDDDDRPRRTRRDDYDDGYDDRRPRGKKSKPGLATAAGVLWAIWAGFEVIGVVSAAINLADVTAAIRMQAAFGGVAIDPEIKSQLTILGGVRMVLNLAAFVLFLLACIRTLTGGAKSIGGYGIATIFLSVITVVYFLATAYVLSNIFAKLGGPFLGGRADGFLYGTMCGAGALAISGSLLAGIFALACNGKYTKWWGDVKGREQYRDDDRD